MSNYRKLIVGLLAFAVTVLTSILAIDETLIPAASLPWVHIFIMVCGSYGIYKVSNEPGSDVNI